MHASIQESADLFGMIVVRPTQPGEEPRVRCWLGGLGLPEGARDAKGDAVVMNEVLELARYSGADYRLRDEAGFLEPGEFHSLVEVADP